MRQRTVNEQHPQGDHHQHGVEPHPLHHRPDNHRRSDDGEGELIHRKYAVGDPRRIVHIGRGSNTVQKEELAPPEIGAVKILPENQAIAHRPPEHGDQTRDTETPSHDRKDVLGAHEPAIEKPQTRQRHENHKRGADHHPRIVPRASDAQGRRPEAFGQIAVLVLIGSEGHGWIRVLEIGSDRLQDFRVLRNGSHGRHFLRRR